MPIQIVSGVLNFKESDTSFGLQSVLLWLDDTDSWLISKKEFLKKLEAAMVRTTQTPVPVAAITSGVAATTGKETRGEASGFQFHFFV